MKRNIPGLSVTVTTNSCPALPDGLYLVRVESALYCWGVRKHFYSLRFSVVEPKALAGKEFSSRLDCTPRATWRLGWFLHDFLYDAELLSQDEVDERALCGLIGVVKVSHTVVDGAPLMKLEGFAPATRWVDLSADTAVPLASTFGGTGKARA